MAKTLDVYLQRELIGHLIQNDGGQMIFDYVESWLKGLMLRLCPTRCRCGRSASRARSAGGTLPVFSQKRAVAQSLPATLASANATITPCWSGSAGSARAAVTFLPAGEPLPARDGHYRALSSPELAGILRELPRRPLLAGESGIRLALAGAQDKIAVRVEGDVVSLPLGGAPSTHILKPAVERFAGVVINEAYCMRLAAAVGLPVAKTEIRRVEDVDYLLIERYDRMHRQGPEGASVAERLHQEDFCQALGIVSENKYQKEGGPSLKQCFALLREVSSAPVLDLARLLDAVIFNYLVGNNDAHGKNFSLLYRGVGTAGMETRLAPLYDVVSTRYYPELTRELAMKIGGEYSSDRVTKTNFEQLTEDAGLAKPLVRRRVPELAEMILSNLDKTGIKHPVAEEISGPIYQRCDTVRNHVQSR